MSRTYWPSQNSDSGSKSLTELILFGDLLRYEIFFFVFFFVTVHYIFLSSHELLKCFKPQLLISTLLFSDNDVLLSWMTMTIKTWACENVCLFDRKSEISPHESAASATRLHSLHISTVWSLDTICCKLDKCHSLTIVCSYRVICPLCDTHGCRVDIKVKYYDVVAITTSTSVGLLT